MFSNTFHRLFLLLICLVFASCSTSIQERIIITNANVYTLAWDEPTLEGEPAENAPIQDNSWQADAEAIVVEGNEILYVGTLDEAMSYQHDKTSIVDVKGATVIPGLVDSHAHPYYFGEDLGKIDLTGISDKTVLLNTLKKKAGEVKEGEWILGFGYDEGNLSVDKLPTKTDISNLFPNNPVFVIGTHGFTSIANEKALELANITAQTEAPVGGEIKRDLNGEPNGIFVNNAAELIEEILPAKTEEDFKDIALYGMQILAESGYTAWHDAGTNSDYMKAFLALEKEQKSILRVYTMIQATDTSLMQDWLDKGPVINKRGMVSVNAVKAYYDASLGQRGALMLEDYSDKAGHRGVSGEDYGFDQDLVAEMMKKGFQVGIHAIGDAGNRDMLNFYANVFNENPALKNNRHRIEHAQVVHPDDFPKFKELNLIASMEPPHMAEDMNWAEIRVGSERIKGAYAWRTFRQHGVPITFNSDLTGSDHNIFYGLYAAITRKNKNREPEGGWYPEQRLSAEEALRAYTSWSAYAAFKENEKGTIEVGKLADLTFINIDILNVGEQNPEQLWDGKILGTMVDGKWVYTTFE